MIDSSRVPWFMTICYSMLAVMLFSNLSAGVQGDQASDLIPPKLQELIAGCENNLSQIRTLQANAQYRIEDVRFLACKDLEGKSYPDQNASISLWKDNIKLRVDTVYDRMFNTRDNTIRYNLPYGEYIMPTTEWERQKDTLKRKHGILQTTMRFMQCEGKTYKYFVESKDCMIDRTTKYFRGPNACEWILTGSIVGSRTFPEYIRSRVKLSGMRSFTVEDLGEGLYAVNDYWVGTRNGQEVSGKAHLIIDSTKGHTVQSIEREAGGQTIYTGKYEYAEVKDIWVLISADYKSYNWRAEVNTVRNKVSLRADLDSVKINEPIDPNTFTVESLNIQKGSLVRNSVTGERYRYNN